MGKIIQLGDSIADKIAAGEVVERPASVVKELVENAIDANSTVIEVEVEEAGLAKIRVIDNGEGMDEEDVVMAFERHATSKIKDEADLFRIRTLGFRGEALPSIASVSRMEVVTGTGEGPGSRLVLEGGKKVLLERASSRKGTDITVSDLFFNTPARLKYVKTIHTELAHITDLMNRLALSRPHIAMKLSHNGKVLLQTNGNGDPRQVLAAIYGVANARKMIPVRGEHLDFRLEGYLSPNGTHPLVPEFHFRFCQRKICQKLRDFQRRDPRVPYPASRRPLPGRLPPFDDGSGAVGCQRPSGETGNPREQGKGTVRIHRKEHPLGFSG